MLACSFVPSARGAYPVLDVSNLAQAIEMVRHQVETVERLQAQIEQQKLMLQHWDFTQLDDVLQRMDALRDQLEQAGNIYTRPDPTPIFNRQFPTTFDESELSVNPVNSLREAWAESYRQTLVENRRVQNTVYTDLGATRLRVDAYIQQSNSAPGVTATVQAGNELTATLIQQVQALQTLEISQARAQVEQEARRQSEEEYSRQLRDWLNREGTVEPVPEGTGTYAVEPIPTGTTGGH
jgi:P-type conjugative transfer protein TrbJ